MSDQSSEVVATAGEATGVALTGDEGQDQGVTSGDDAPRDGESQEDASSEDAPADNDKGRDKGRDKGKPRRRKHTSAKKSARYGMTLRKAVPRDVFSAWRPSPRRPLAFDAGLRNRKIASAYDLFSARSQSMAYDISTLPMTGIEVQLCADARVDNFGLFRVPGGMVVCDLYDFSHTVRGPWEWDVARLATSIELALRERGTSAERRRRVVENAVREYRLAMRWFASQATTDVWRAQRDASALATQLGLTTDDVMWWLDNAVVEDADGRKALSAILDEYYKTLQPEWRRFAGRCTLGEVVRLHNRSGARTAWAVTLEGARPSDSVTLLVEEARESAIQPFVGKAPQPSHGHRVVDGQRAVQAVDDVLLGWATLQGDDGALHSYYVRSLWPSVCDLDVLDMGPRKMGAFAKACAWTIAHAHARTGNRFSIAAYLGKADKFDRAAAEFAHLYAAQCVRDFKAL